MGRRESDERRLSVSGGERERRRRFSEREREE